MKVFIQSGTGTTATLEEANPSNMNLMQFVNTYIGKKVDFDGAFGAQCVDLFRQYCKDVLRSGHTGAVEGAKDLYLEYDQLPKEREVFDRVRTRSPETGDVAVWGASATNKYGHVAIVIGTEKSTGRLIVFEQDGYRQDGAKIAARTKENLLGVLRFKGGSVTA